MMIERLRSDDYKSNVKLYFFCKAEHTLSLTLALEMHSFLACLSEHSALCLVIAVKRIQDLFSISHSSCLHAAPDKIVIHSLLASNLIK